MSKTTLKEKVIEKCRWYFVDEDFEKLHLTQIHKYIIEEVEKNLTDMIGSFKSQWHTKSSEEADNFRIAMMEQYCSDTYRSLFKGFNDDVVLQKNIKKCLVKDTRVTKNLFEENKIEDKSLDFYCMFLRKEGWNKWKEQLAPSSFNLIIENNSQDKSITQRVEIRDLPKALNTIPIFDTENCIPRIELLENLFEKTSEKSHKITLSGISGLGKTFIAKHFIHHYYETFDHIVWLNCGNGIQNSLTQEKGVELLDNLGLIHEYQSFLQGKIKEEELLSLAFNRLKKTEGNNILVLDNIDEEIYDFEDVVELSRNWIIIGTSQEILDGFYHFNVPDFSKNGIELFYKFYQIEQDDDNLIRILSAIEYHTLAIELLAKTAQQRGLRIIELVNRFIENGINVVEKAKVISGHSKERKLRIENIEEYINVIFDTSSLDEEECKILLNISILQEEAIPMDLFTEVYLNNSSDKKLIDVFVHNKYSLVNKGWIQIENDNIRVHNLVKGIIIKKYIHRNDFFNSTVQYFKKVLHKNSINKTVMIRYLSLLESLLENSNKEDRDIIYLKQVLANIYAFLGLFYKSKTIMSEIPETDDIHEVIAKYHNLSVISMNQGNSEQAFFYANYVYSLFGADIWEEDFNTITDELENFLKNVKIKTASVFEGNRDLEAKILSIEMVFNCDTIMTNYDKNKSIHEKIDALKQAISIRNQLLSIFEENLPEDLLFLIDIYKDIVLRKESYYRYIGLYYIELKEFTKAEEYLKSMLGILETKLSNEDLLLFYNYHSLTTLYLWWEDLDNAKYFIEKTRKICETFPLNHANHILYKNDVLSLETLEKKKSTEENIYKSIQSRFDLLFEVNKSFTDLWEYYYHLCCIYYDNNDIEKAYDYAQKEVRFLLSIGGNYSVLAHAYIRLGMCSVPLKNLECATEVYDLVVKLFTENKVNDPEISQKAHYFKYYLVKMSIHADKLSIIQSFIKSDILLVEKYCDSKKIPHQSAVFNMVKKIFYFLSDLPDIKDNINWNNIIEDWAGLLEKRVEMFVCDYNIVFDKSLQEFAESESVDFSVEEIRYDILMNYYQTIGDFFNEYERWDVAVQYYIRKIILIESEYIDEYEGIEDAYYDVSVCFFKLLEFEISYNIIREGINQMGEILEKQNQRPEYKEYLKKVLKESLDLEERIKEELEKFRKT